MTTTSVDLASIKPDDDEPQAEKASQLQSQQAIIFLLDFQKWKRRQKEGS